MDSSSTSGLLLKLAVPAAALFGFFVGNHFVRPRIFQDCSKIRGDQKFFAKEDAPAWLQGLFDDENIHRVLLREWEDSVWRRENGWAGHDLIHNPNSDSVCVRAYFWNKAELTLSGIVTFGRNAESHRGLCHGGAMTSVMDDVCGHVAFLGGNGPWNGATVQVNCSLKKPVKIGETLKVIGKIDRKESRKVFISAQLVNEAGDIYVDMKGISILGVSLAEGNDEVTTRTWLSASECADDFVALTGTNHQWSRRRRKDGFNRSASMPQQPVLADTGWNSVQ